jgi:predicted Zn-dependent protease
MINNMIGTGAEVFARGLDKSAEYEADAVGVVLAARAGYNPFGLVDVLHKLAARGAGDNSMALLLKTHPLPGDRLAQLGELLTPNLARLPPGREPDLRRVASGAGNPRAAKPLPAEGARGLAAQPAQPAAPQPAQQPQNVPALDPMQLLRGILGR